MKAKMAFRAVALFAATALAASGLTAGALAPAQAATKSTVTLLSAGNITSLNSDTSDGNSVYNATVESLTRMGFSYYDDKTKLVMNTRFGTMKIVKNEKDDFRIQYTVRPGQTWSDGTPITAHDLLLSHIITSNQFSIDAGLGDPSSKTQKPSFDSVGYSSTYGNNVVGDPVVSSDGMSITTRFKKQLPDWQLLAPGVFPVHALALMADGRTTLQPVNVGVTAKQTFLTAFKKKNTAFLKRMGAIWTKDYNVSKVDRNTNPLLLVSNGGFIVQSYTAGSSMTLVRNPRYSSGPAMATRNPIRTVVIKVITDNTAAVQALRNGDIDIYYNSLPTNNDRAALSAMPNVTLDTNVGGNYSFIHLRVSNAAQERDTYSGPFAGNSQRAKDLRRAFMLAMPREQIVEVLIKPLNPKASPLDTQFAFQGTPEYNTITRASGVSEFTRGTQAQRTAQALALVQKHFPNASATNAPVKISFVHANVALRNQIGALVAAEAKKAGFDVTSFASANLFGNRDNLSARHDASMHGFQLTSLAQSNATGIFKSDGANNAWGWNNPELDKILLRLQNDVLTPSQITKLRSDADKIIMSEYWGLPLYANPTITAFNKALKNVKTAPIGNNITWNFFEWSY